jgi:hypothetical protein
LPSDGLLLYVFKRYTQICTNSQSAKGKLSLTRYSEHKHEICAINIIQIQEKTMKNLSAALAALLLAAAPLAATAATAAPAAPTANKTTAAPAKIITPAKTGTTAKTITPTQAGSSAKTATTKPAATGSTHKAAQNAPGKNTAPTGKIVCKDGSTSPSKTTRGACSKHGGIAKS